MFKIFFSKSRYHLPQDRQPTTGDTSQGLSRPLVEQVRKELLNSHEVLFSGWLWCDLCCLCIYLYANVQPQCLQCDKQDDHSGLAPSGGVNVAYTLMGYHQRRSNLRTGLAAYFCIIGFLVIFLCMVAPPVAARTCRVSRHCYKICTLTA